MRNKKCAIWPIFMAESPKLLHHIGNRGRWTRWWHFLLPNLTPYRCQRFDYQVFYSSPSAVCLKSLVKIPSAIVKKSPFKNCAVFAIWYRIYPAKSKRVDWNCRSGHWRSMNKRWQTLKEWTLTEEIAGVNIVGVNNDGVIDSELTCSKTANCVKISV